MSDKELLKWIYRRLVYKYGENPSYDYMLKLRAVITTIPEDVNTPWSQGKNIEDLVDIEWEEKVRNEIKRIR